ncbi:MAG: 2-isopropylmalate synthase [Myxococcales bacterium]|nr:2-isopropylmalate synthase [Myxococcales bacterium]
MRRIHILDTSLRDGEQAPGASMSIGEKREVARALARLGVDVIEAGFPAASPDDHAAVAEIAATVGQAERGGAPPPVIQALARAHAADLDAAWAAIRGAARPRLHTFLATSDLHLEHKLRMSRAEVLARIDEMVRYARRLCADVAFSPEDAGRSDRGFLHEAVAAAIAAGATVINLPDTVGYTLPDEFGALVAGVLAEVPGARDVIVSVHCHDDLGLAVANSLAGLRAGASQAEVTINGIGERAGNASLEELVMLVATRAPVLGLTTGIDTTQLVAASRVVARATSFAVAPNKAVVGANAFAHESGIHQDGMLKHQRTYEIMRPEDVGAQTTRLVLGKHSGRHAVAERLAALGVALDADALARVFAGFKRLADRKRAILDADLLALAAPERAAAPVRYALDDLQVACGTVGLATATVRLRDPDGVLRVQAAVGTGPVDATYKAINAIVAAPVELMDFVVHAVTEGIDALGEVSVRVAGGADRPVHGHGADTDIVVASAKAYLEALNHLLARTPAALGELAGHLSRVSGGGPAGGMTPAGEGLATNPQKAGAA